MVYITVTVTSQQEGAWWFPHLSARKGHRDKPIWDNASSFCSPGVRWPIFVYRWRKVKLYTQIPPTSWETWDLNTVGWGAPLTRALLPTTSWRAAWLSRHPVTHGYLPVSPFCSCQSRPGDHPLLPKSQKLTSNWLRSSEEGTWSFGEAPMSQRQTWLELLSVIL